MMRPLPQGRYIQIIPWIPAVPLLAYLVGASLACTALCILTNFRARTAAIALGVFYLLSDLALLIDKLLLTRTAIFEILALAAGALTLARTLPSAPHTSSTLLDKFLQSGRYIFAICCVLFGVDHFIYFRFVASLVPAWIPGSGAFWTSLTGSAMIAAGISFAIKWLDLWAANLLGLMFLLIFLVLHIPRVMAQASLHNPDEWSSALIALAMCGVCWILGCDSRRERPVEGV